MSDTPRTDKVEKLAYWFNDDMTPVCESGFVRSLERELTTAQDRIKRLEEAGDNVIKAMRDEVANYCEWIALAHDAELSWNKAKEAKP